MTRVSDRDGTMTRMSGEDHWRATTRAHPVNVIPDPELPLHRDGGSCWCEPTLETWRTPGQVTYRLVHRPLTVDPCGAVAAGRVDDDGVTCKRRRGHASTRHQDRDATGRLLAEWST